MIIQTGIDIVEVDRMKRAIEKWGDEYLKKLFTDTEIKYSNSKRFPCQHYAARFAAKEACIKAFGGIKNFPIRWTDIEVMNDAEGKPAIWFHNEAKRLKVRSKISGVSVSMSHSRQYAVASAILTG
ncbi:MAG: holo-ACP synthase [Candidatus Omnitrophota bacterium]